MTNLLPIIIDAVIVLSAALMVWLGYRRGFIRTAIYAVGYLASAVIASVVGKWLGELITGWCRTPLVEYTAGKIGTETGSLTESVEAMYSRAPVLLQNWMNHFGSAEELAEKISSSAESAAQNAAGGITDYVLLPIVSGIAGIVLFFVLFFVCCFLVRKIAYISGVVDYGPIVSGLNHMAGGLIGIVQAAVVGFLLVLVVSLVLLCVPNGTEIAEKTYIFGWLNGWMPFFRLS